MEEQNDGRELDKPDEKQFIYENGPHGSVCFSASHPLIIWDEEEFVMLFMHWDSVWFPWCSISAVYMPEKLRGPIFSEGFLFPLADCLC